MYILMAHRLNFQTYIVFLSLKIYFVFANSADSDEMLHFIKVFTVCKSTHLGVSYQQRVKFGRDINKLRSILKIVER